MELENVGNNKSLLIELRTLIITSRQKVALTVNAELTILYWHIGEKLRREVLGSERATYGKSIVKNISKQLSQEFGQGFSEKVLRHCIRFAEVLPNFSIVSTASRQLSWSHFLDIEIQKKGHFQAFQITKTQCKTFDFWEIEDGG